MAEVNLIATLPQGSLVATSLGIEGFGWHRSPGSAKHFQGRSIFLELPHDGGKPSFELLNEGGWRDATADTEAALTSVLGGKRTKTALSNGVFSAVPVHAVTRAFLVKTSGRALELQREAKDVCQFTNHTCTENLTPEQIAEIIGRPGDPNRPKRFYLVLAPIELLVLSNLSPFEYAWYAAHRPGKVFRQCCFAELDLQHVPWVAEARFQSSLEEIARKPTKKTKTVAMSNLMNEAPFHRWIGYDRREEGGLYLADRDSLWLARFPKAIPFPWERAP